MKKIKGGKSIAQIAMFDDTTALAVDGILRETEKGFHVQWGDDQTKWIPKSQIELRIGNVFYVSGWFYKKFQQNGSHFSDDNKRRYVLWREWDMTKKIVLCIGLNPSIADGDFDDQTISRLTNILHDNGYGGFRMVNLYTHISPKPTELIGKAEDNFHQDVGIIGMNSLLCQEIVFCWGAFKEAKSRAQVIKAQYPDALCFGKTADGSPWHPLALMYAGMKDGDVGLFKFSTHDSRNNQGKPRKNRRKKKKSTFTETKNSTLIT